MKLQKSSNTGDLYYEEDGIYYTRPFRMDILTDKGKKMGELTGHLINMERVWMDIKRIDGSNFFVELDCISHLLSMAASYILEHKQNLKDIYNVCFLNRITLDEEYVSPENEAKALDLLFEYAECVIYSLGSTELDDDFPEYNETYWNEHEELINKLNWVYNSQYNFYVKYRFDLWDNEAIEKRVQRPFETIKITIKEVPFWTWLFNDAMDIAADAAYQYIEKSEDWGRMYYLGCLHKYEFAKDQLEVIEEWSKNDYKGKVPTFNISPYSLYLFLYEISSMKEMREEGSCVSVSFHDEDVEKNMTKIVNKYYKKFNRCAHLVGFGMYFEPMVERYFKLKDDTWLESVHNDIKKKVENYRSQFRNLVEEDL